MKTVTGVYNQAIVYTDVVDDTALEQIKTLCDQEFVKGLKIRMMPDVHAGAGSTIGTTMTIRDTVVPNLVGVDIGCGMETIRIRNQQIDLRKLDEVIRERIPSGFSVRETRHSWNDLIDLTGLRCLKSGKINLERAEKSLGTLGGGNHFIEMNQDSRGRYYAVIHSGSRHLGLEVAHYYQSEAWKSLQKPDDSRAEKLIKEYRATGREKEIQAALYQLNKDKKQEVPRDLAYVSGQLMEDYLHDMTLVQCYARLNRKAMMEELIREMKWEVEEGFTTIHNYIDTESMVLRKGAVSARRGEKLLIPINMRDGSLICIGKGNEEWNCSAPHGAGRLMSRREAKRVFTVSEFKQEMKGIYTTSVSDETLDECPMAYKAMEDIAGNIMDTAEITEVIKPVYNFKAGGD